MLIFLKLIIQKKIVYPKKCNLENEYTYGMYGDSCKITFAFEHRRPLKSKLYNPFVTKRQNDMTEKKQDSLYFLMHKHDHNDQHLRLCFYIS